MPDPPKDGGVGNPPGRSRKEDPSGLVWVVLRAVVQVANLVAAAGKHEAFTWSVKAFAVLVDAARGVWRRRR